MWFLYLIPPFQGSLRTHSCGQIPLSFLRMTCPEFFCCFPTFHSGNHAFRSPTADMPPLKGEVPAEQAVGFLNEESGSFNLWLPDSCSVRRQQAAVALTDQQQVRAGSACPSRQCRPSIRRELCGFEETSRSNLWRLVSCSVRRQQVEPGTARPPLERSLRSPRNFNPGLTARAI